MHTDAWFSFYIKKDFHRHFAERCSQKRPICIFELSSLEPATLHNKDNRESTSTEYHSTGVKKFIIWQRELLTCSISSVHQNTVDIAFKDDTYPTEIHFRYHFHYLIIKFNKLKLKAFTNESISPRWLLYIQYLILYIPIYSLYFSCDFV